MSVEQHHQQQKQQQQQQQLTAIELTKPNNNNNNTNNISANANSNSNNGNGNNIHCKTNNDLLKHNNDVVNLHKAKEELLEKSTSTSAGGIPNNKQNGQHYNAETNGGEHLKVANDKREKSLLDEANTIIDSHEEKSENEISQQQKHGENENNEAGDEDDEDDEPSLNTACIIKSPLNKTLLKKCTPNGNGNLSPLALNTSASSHTCCCDHEEETSSPNVHESSTLEDLSSTAASGGGHDKPPAHFDPFTKIPIPTTSSMPTTTTTTNNTSATPSNANQTNIKCTKCNNNNNIHYNNYNCYYRKKAARLKPSICRKNCCFC
ncbi:uncharacterized protein DDB_G0288805-like [Musca domestica]|uniref:Uncharacterized protein DDB_G0288805-like n=1 Tax=Musca domestica TaxID=7370 RepID=A0A1I8NL58_MUSDO|nr:uncharacterized protein DDB_G0288805-like [Musca domestica]